ncbi:hypothetical protein [Oceaniglobus ichthyenteri]|uniref:hypothetical protein n=1 Tax=Oceaniglobus ichthyenteri TaxID=2136177 RepID=UPI000D3885A2|nr:hypothetical protein [Oceaniglobus ichthyenteri]
MNPDIALVLGVIFLALAVPSLLSAFSESRPPRAAMIMIVLAGGAIYFAITSRPGGYAIADIPEAFVRVIGMILN